MKSLWDVTNVHEPTPKQVIISQAISDLEAIKERLSKFTNFGTDYFDDLISEMKWYADEV